MVASLAGTGGIVGAVLTAIAAPVGAYLLAARKMSGQIKTTSADELWAEARDMRRTATRKISELESRIERLEAINVDLLRENMELKQKVSELQSIIEDLQKTITRLTSTILDQTIELKGKR